MPSDCGGGMPAPKKLRRPVRGRIGPSCGAGDVGRILCEPRFSRRISGEAGGCGVCKKGGMPAGGYEEPLRAKGGVQDNRAGRIDVHQGRRRWRCGGGAKLWSPGAGGCAWRDGPVGRLRYAVPSRTAARADAHMRPLQRCKPRRYPERARKAGGGMF